jgi:hypothetical protein
MSNQSEKYSLKEIENKIFTIRGIHVMIDSDIAEMYEVETKVLNQAVKRNIARFPDSFRFQLTEEETINLRSQIVTLKREDHSLRSQPVTLESQRGKHRKYLPYVFTEQGIFFEGQMFDAYTFTSDLIRSAKKSIILIDNYIDDSVLTLLSKRQKNVLATIYTKNMGKQLKLDLKKHNSQYPGIKVHEFKAAHDRFLILDETQLYHFGASLKDLGKKWFAFSRMDSMTDDVLQKLKNGGGYE